MHRIAILVVLAFVAVPAALADDSPSPSSQASTLCKQQRAAVGTTAFKLLYGGSANAYGRCVSKLAGTVQSENANAAKQCAAERADTSFAASHDGKTFAQVLRLGAARQQRLRRSASRPRRRRSPTTGRSRRSPLPRRARPSAPRWAQRHSRRSTAAAPTRSASASRSSPRRASNWPRTEGDAADVSLPPREGCFSAPLP